MKSSLMEKTKGFEVEDSVDQVPDNYQVRVARIWSGTR